MTLIPAPSPNFNDRPAGAAVDCVILHYTGMQTGQAALDRLRDPAAQVSSHYLVEEDGRVFQLVAEEKRAWHAGVSVWQGRSNLNDVSIGIELVNPGHDFGYRPFPAQQMDGLMALLAGIAKRHIIPRARYLGHSDIAPTRKQDPGELFPWAQLAGVGFGLWSGIDGGDRHAIVMEKGDDPAFNSLKKQLGIVGYDITGCMSFDATVVSIVRAFQAHWRPQFASGVFDVGTAAILNDIATQSIQPGETL